MKNNEIELNKAKELHLSNKIKEAQKIYLKLIKSDKKNSIIFFLLGTTYLQQKKFEEAIKYLRRSVKIDPSYPNPYNNLGIALAETTNFTEAKVNYDKAIELNKNYIDAYLNRGITQNKLKKYDEAMNDFRIVGNINPNNAKLLNNIGNVYKNLKQYDKANKCYEKAISIQPNYLEAISNLSSILHIEKKYKESLNYLEQIYKIDPEFKGVIENIISNKMHIFEWSNLKKFKEKIKNQFLNNETSFDPLFIHYLFDDPSLHKLNAEKFCEQEFKYIIKQSPKKQRFKNKKIKIGYFASDYHNHPVLHIMRNIFKSHNNEKFEIYAFSLGPDKTNNLWRDDIKPSFKKFLLVNNFSDEEIINLTNKYKIDIAVDLSGLTKNARPNLFFKRLAPIQITYLGYPGTSGNKEMDYIIADNTVIPEKAKKYYTEKVLYLPGSYIASSSDILLTEKENKFKRKDFLLPEEQIVFCAFHNPLKINPKLFDSWCNILMGVVNSVLWIKASGDISKKNLEKEFTLRKINLKRVIFADGVEDISDHINRLRLADIFLDTYPYNSHSTTYDYIRADLPMIIMKGETFSSRVGASIYKSIEMDELISNNYKEYEKIAIELGNDKLKLKKIREKLKLNSQKYKLFDSKEITKNLEKVYLKLLN